MKVVLDDTSSGYDLATINTNFQKVEDELNNKVLYRDNPVGEPNALSSPIDANSQRIYNLPEPLNANEAARLQDVQNAISGATAANLISFTPTVDITSTNVQSAIVEVYNDLLAKIGSFIDPADYGAVGDGVADDTAELLASATAAVANGAVWKLRTGKTYKFSQLSLPANLLIMGEGAVLRSDASLTGSNVTLTLGANTVANALTLTSAGTETNTDILDIGNGSTLGRLVVSSDAQRAGGGVITKGQDVRIGACFLTRIDRGFHVYNTDTVTPTTGFYMGYLRVHSYVRAWRATHAYGYVVLHTYATGRSANASNSPGHNGALIVGCSDWSMPFVRLEDSGEHAFRVGGSDGGGASDNYVVGKLVSVRSGGCALKLNPTVTVASVTEKTSGWEFGEILGIDVGDNSAAGNKELLRLSHVRKGRIGSAYAIKDGATFSGQYGLLINDADDIEIGSLGGDGFNAGFIYLDSTSDISGGTVADSVTNLRINQLTGVAPGTNAIAIDMNAFNYGNIFVKNVNITGFTTNFARVISGTINGPVLFQGMVTGSVAPLILTPPSSSSFIVDLVYNRTQVSGRADTLRYGVDAVQRTFPVFNPANVVPNGLLLNAAEGTAGSGNYGAAIEWTRVGSSRRGLAIGLVQTGVNQQNTGFQVSTGVTTSASDQVIPSLRVSHEAALQILDGIGVPTTTAGWAQIYVDTTDGDLKVKFGDGVVKTLATDT